MIEYHKIQTVFKRDPNNKFKTLLEGEYSLPEFEFLKNAKWQFTEKFNGTCIRIIKNKKGILFKGKTDNAQMSIFLLEKLQDLFFSDALEEYFPDTDVCLYGEGIGSRIQKGGGNYIPDGQDFVLFDVKIDNYWLQRKDVEDIADKLKIKVAPIIGEGSLIDMISMTRQGFKSQWGDFIAEGIVARPKVELFSRNSHRIITKIKHKDFPK